MKISPLRVENKKIHSRIYWNHTNLHRRFEHKNVNETCFKRDSLEMKIYGLCSECTKCFVVQLMDRKIHDEDENFLKVSISHLRIHMSGNKSNGLTSSLRSRIFFCDSLEHWETCAHCASTADHNSPFTFIVYQYFSLCQTLHFSSNESFVFYNFNLPFWLRQFELVFFESVHTAQHKSYIGYRFNILKRRNFEKFSTLHACQVPIRRTKTTWKPFPYSSHSSVFCVFNAFFRSTRFESMTFSWHII